MPKTINVPALVSFSDYHEIRNFRDNIREILPWVGVTELGFMGRYIALVYVIGDKPKSKEINDLLKKSGYGYTLKELKAGGIFD